jgi:hypothetical protein
MAEPPASWDQQDDENSTLSSTTSKLGRLNVNAMEFVPTFGSGFSLAPKVPTVPQATLPKIPASTPVVPQNTTENENENEKKQTEPVIKVNEPTVQQQVKEPITTTEEGEYDELPGEDNES